MADSFQCNIWSSGISQLSVGYLQDSEWEPENEQKHINWIEATKVLTMEKDATVN